MLLHGTCQSSCRIRIEGGKTVITRLTAAAGYRARPAQLFSENRL